MAKEQQAVENKPVETQEMINALVEKADVALRKYMEMDQEAVDRIVQAMALPPWGRIGAAYETGQAGL